MAVKDSIVKNRMWLGLGVMSLAAGMVVCVVIKRRFDAERTQATNKVDETLPPGELPDKAGLYNDTEAKVKQEDRDAKALKALSTGASRPSETKMVAENGKQPITSIEVNAATPPSPERNPAAEAAQRRTILTGGDTSNAGIVYDSVGTYSTPSSSATEGRKMRRLLSLVPVSSSDSPASVQLPPGGLLDGAKGLATAAAGAVGGLLPGGAAQSQPAAGRTTVGDSAGTPPPYGVVPQSFQLKPGKGDSLISSFAPFSKAGDLTSAVANRDVDFAPYGRLVPCRLVNTLESFNHATPVIALVSEDVWWNNKLIIPAGTELHGIVSGSIEHGTAIPRAGITTARLASGLDWRLILPSSEDGDRLSGAELRLRGSALGREAETTLVRFGIEDGAFGFPGRLITADATYDDIKLFLATGLAAGANALQDTQNVGSYGATAPAPTARNASLASVAAVLDEKAKQIMAQLKAAGSFVMVPAGTEFYLYVQQSIVPAQADMPSAPYIAPNREFELDAATRRKALLQAAGEMPADGTPAIPGAEYYKSLEKAGVPQ